MRGEKELLYRVGSFGDKKNMINLSSYRYIFSPKSRSRNRGRREEKRNGTWKKKGEPRNKFHQEGPRQIKLWMRIGVRDSRVISRMSGKLFPTLGQLWVFDETTTVENKKQVHANSPNLCLKFIRGTKSDGKESWGHSLKTDIWGKFHNGWPLNTSPRRIYPKDPFSWARSR